MHMNELDIIKIIKFIDYTYLSNFISNSIKNVPESSNDEFTNDDWKIFSTQCINEKYNILYFINTIIHMLNYNFETLLISIHVYTKICKQYAHVINNYTCLFAAVYGCIAKLFNNKITNNLVSEILNISDDVSNHMMMIVEKFMEFNDIYFGSNEEQNLIHNIYILEHA